MHMQQRNVIDACTCIMLPVYRVVNPITIENEDKPEVVWPCYEEVVTIIEDCKVINVCLYSQ